MAQTLRDLSAEELAWIAESTAGLLRQQPDATAYTGFDDPPDAFPAVLRSERPC